MSGVDQSALLTAGALIEWWQRTEPELSRGPWVLAYAEDVSVGEHGVRIENPALERTDVVALATALNATVVVVAPMVMTATDAEADTLLAAEEAQAAAVVTDPRSAAEQGRRLVSVDVLLLGAAGPVVLSVTTPEVEHDRYGPEAMRVLDEDEGAIQDEAAYQARRKARQAEIALAVEERRATLLAEDALCSKRLRSTRGHLPVPEVQPAGPESARPRQRDYRPAVRRGVLASPPRTRGCRTGHDSRSSGGPACCGRRQVAHA